MIHFFRFTFLSAFLLISISAVCQKTSITLDAVHDNSDIDKQLKVGNNTLALDIKPMKLVAGLNASSPFAKIPVTAEIVSYSADFKIVKKVDLLVDGLKPNSLAPELEMINNKPFLIFLNYDGNSTHLKIAEINPETLQISPSTELVKFSFGDISIWKASMSDIVNESKIEVNVSPDKSKTIVHFYAGDGNFFAFAVIDENGKMISSYYREKGADKVVVTSACVDNAGTAYIGFKVEKKKFIEGHILVAKIGAAVNDIVLSTTDEIFQVMVKPSRKGNIIHIAGNIFGDSQYLNSIFFGEIKIPNVAFSGYTKFQMEDKFIDLFNQHKLAFTKGNKTGLYPFSLSLNEQEDGSVDITGNPSRIERPTGSGNLIFWATSIFNAHYNKGQVVFTRIPRSSSLYAQVGSDFFAIPFKNVLHVFYLDNEKNISKPLDEMPNTSQNFNSFVLVDAVVQPDGSITRRLVSDLTSEDMLAIPGSAKMINANTFTILFSKYKGTYFKEKEMLGTVVLQ